MSLCIQMIQHMQIAGFIYVLIYNICSNFKFSLTGPSTLTVNITTNIESSSIVVQWDTVDDFLLTTYTITWSDDKHHHGGDTVEEQTSYTITGLTLDTVYTIIIIIVNTANMCGDGPEL